MKPKHFLILLATVAGCAGGHDSITGPTDSGFPSYVKLQSDAGDYIGAGKSYDYTTANANLTVQANGEDLTINIQGDESWHGDFHLPSSAGLLQAGTYANATRYLGAPTQPSMDWFGEGRGCNTLTATVTIDGVSYANGSLASLDMHFEQHCEGMTAALHGTIHWKIGDPTKIAGPVNPIPASLWRPAITLPTSGNYIYLTSEQGDYIGQGGTYLYTPTNSTMSLSASGAHLGVIVNSYDWTGDFQAMSSLELLQVGYYPNLQRFPFNNPVRGGLSWSGMGRGCNTLTGWFAIDAVTYSGVTLTSIDLRFEQHCEGGTPSLHGAIHWHA